MEEKILDALKNYLIEDEVLVKYYGSEEIVNIPDGVKEIGKKAFYENYNIVKVCFPSTLLTISENAFEKCYNLKEVIFPADSKLSIIDSYAFFQTGIESFVMPSTLCVLGLGAFQACDKLSQITFNNTIDNISAMCFAFCELLTKINLPNSITKISMAAFYACGLTELKLPSKIVEIDTLAFARNRLKEVHLPKSIRRIGTAAFYNSGYVFDGWEGTTLIYKETCEDAWSPYIIFDGTEAERKKLNLGYDWFTSGFTTQESLEWVKKGLCKYCGGTMSGIFTKKCNKCGAKKIW